MQRFDDSSRRHRAAFGKLTAALQRGAFHTA
jgi:hypothetical protein